MAVWYCAWRNFLELFRLRVSLHEPVIFQVCEVYLNGCLLRLGGAYGIVRVTLGSLPGYLVACFDCYQSMFYTMLSVLLIGYLISFVTESEKKWNPLWWFIIYCSYLVVHTIGGVFFWRTLKTLSIGSLALLVIYILGSIKFANFEENAPLDVKAGHSEIEAWFTGGALKFFQVLPVYCWMFVGVESLNLAAHDAVDPKKDIPKAYVLSYITIFCTALSTIFVACSVSPGVDVLKLWFMPQSFGYQLMFDVDLKTAFILGIPAIYTSGFTFMYYYSSQIRAMGKSGLVNPWLGYDIPYFHTPVPALLFGAIIGFAVGLRYQYYRVLKHEDVFSISLLGAILTYFSQFISFITFRLHYPTIRREFLSPLGIAGAVYGMLVFGIVLVTLLGLEKSPAIIAFGVYLVVLLIYYALVVQKRQVYSDEERTVLFKAYLMKSKFPRQLLSDCGRADELPLFSVQAIG
jgi:ethanolamine permease